MVSIPVWLVGADTTAVTITPEPLTKATGALTPGSDTELSAVFESVSIEIYRSSTTIMPATATREHNVPIYDGYRVSLDLFQVYGAEPDTLLALFLAQPYFKFVLTRGGKSATCHVMFKDLTTGTSGQNEQHTMANFICIDTGSSTFFTYA